MQNPSKWLYSVYCSFLSGHATSIFHPLMSCNAKIASVFTLVVMWWIIVWQHQVHLGSKVVSDDCSQIATCGLAFPWPSINSVPLDLSLSSVKAPEDSI